MKRIFLTVIIMLLSGSCQSRSRVNLATVGEFELERYLGLWYEIARFENRFERGMTSPTALYTLREDGLVRVENSGDRDGVRHTAIGKAKLDKSGGPGALKVAFFLNFYAPYRILMLGDNYEYALVSSGEKYLWILARAPRLAPDVLEKILLEARSRGFDTDKLIYT